MLMMEILELKEESIRKIYKVEIRRFRMDNINKFLVIGILGLFLVGCVSAYSVKYSEPTYKDGSKIEWKESKPSPIKIDCQRNEWNKNFEDYRAGILSKSYMINYVGGCKW